MMTVERRFWPGYMTLFRSYHDGLFGGSATYRAHMAEIEAQR